MVNKVDSDTWGNRNTIPMDPNLKWVRARAQNLMMPYPTILIVIMEPIFKGDVSRTTLNPDMSTDLEEFQKSWILTQGRRGHL